MAYKRNTLNELLIPLLDLPTVKTDHCIVCGRRFPLEQHHPIRRGAGKAYDENGKEIPKPTITLCGFGNTLKGPDGYLCHGMTHHHLLHFKEMNGKWAFLITEEPTRYESAINMEGWRYCFED